jgi:hypothetical protein
VSPIRKLSVTNFKAGYNTVVISNGLKETITDRALIGNGFRSPLPIGLTFVINGHTLMSVTTNSCNGRLRSQLSEVLICNGRCGGKPRGGSAVLMGNGRQTTTVTDVGACNGC